MSPTEGIIYKIPNREGQSEFFEEDELRTIMRDLVNGLEYLHGLGIIHRDLKP